MGGADIAYRVKHPLQAAGMGYPKVSSNVELPNPASYRLSHYFVGKI